MSRIAATLSGVDRSLLNRLAEANAASTVAALRLTTGSKINYPSDDPSAFVRLSGLQSQLSTVRAVMDNVTAATSMVSQTQSNLDEIRTQLSAIRTELVQDEDGALTQAERDAAQANIDAAIDAIDDLVTTEIDGRRLLDGSANYTITGRNSSQVSEVRVYSTGGATVSISGQVTQAAAQAEVTYTGDASDQVTDDAAFTLSGELGSVDFSVTSGQALSAVASEINSESHLTGVTASVDTVAHTLTFTSVEYGSAASVDIDVTSGTFAVSDGGSATGVDAEATIGGIAQTGEGNLLSIRQNATQYSVEFADDFSGDFDTITVSGDALTFALWQDLTRTSTLAIPGMQSWNLGGQSGRLDQLHSGGSLDGLGDNTSQAIRIVDEALGKLTRIEGVVDGFSDATISSASNVLSDLEDTLEDAIDDINLVDDTEEAERFAHYQELASNAIASLAILEDQRSTIVTLVQRLAGLI